jgi:lysozyme family protein
MPTAEFIDALPFVLQWEGGYVNHPNDPGGATNKGVTQKVYDAWRSKNGLPVRDVRQLEERELQALYESGYWVPPKCPALASPLDLVQFDTAVNMGVGRAVKFLQKAVGAEPDGAYGPGTQRCVDNCDTGTALIAYCDIREAYYRSLASNNPKLAVFLKGWLNRLNALRKRVGLPGYESVDDEVDFGEAGYMGRVPDIGEDPAYDRF